MWLRLGLVSETYGSSKAINQPTLYFHHLLCVMQTSVKQSKLIHSADKYETFNTEKIIKKNKLLLGLQNLPATNLMFK